MHEELTLGRGVIEVRFRDGDKYNIRFAWLLEDLHDYSHALAETVHLMNYSQVEQVLSILLRPLPFLHVEI